MTPVTESLRHSARDGLERGILDPAPQEVWAGTARACVVCATVISPDQIENEIVLRHWNGSHALGSRAMLENLALGVGHVRTLASSTVFRNSPTRSPSRTFAR